MLGVVRGGCAQRVCAGVVRWGLCVLVRRSVGRLCVGIVRKVVRSGCAPIVRSPGQKYCALRTAQPFWVVQDSVFSVAQPFRPLCEIYFVEFFSVKYSKKL